MEGLKLTWLWIDFFFAVLLVGTSVACGEIDWSAGRFMDSLALVPQILTPFNYVDWRENMQVSLHKLGLFRMTMGWEIEPHHPTEKNKFLNQLDESFGFLCTHISWYLLFHLVGLKTLKENWEKLESLFGKQDELRGKILENELIALKPNSFETIQYFFTKFKSLALQCK